MSERHQGYKNYGTFTLHMEIHSDTRQKLEYWREGAREAYADAEADQVFTRLERAELILCDRLQEFFEEQIPELGGWQGTLLGDAFSKVDWMELARELLEEATE